MQNWSTEKLLVNIDELNREVENLNDQIKVLEEQRTDEEARVDICVDFLKSLLHPENLGWAVTQEVRDEVKQTLIKIGEYYGN